MSLLDDIMGPGEGTSAVVPTQRLGTREPDWGYRPEPQLAPARSGFWRRGVSKKQEAEARRAKLLQTIGQPYYSTKFVAVGDPKGDAGKTWTSILLAAAFGQYSGKQIALLDNNPSGNLRTVIEYSPPAPLTINDMAEEITHIRSRGGTDLSLNPYMLYQQQGRFHVLLSRIESTHEEDGQRVLDAPTITEEQFCKVAQIVGGQYPITVIDSGNSYKDYPWRGAVSLVDAVVIPFNWDGDKVDGVKKLLHNLWETGHEVLAQQAILVETHAPGHVDNLKNKTEFTAWLEHNGLRKPMVIPPDPVPVRGEPVLWDRLSPATRDAALELCAAVSERFAANDTMRPARLDTP
jgi:cellulose biosynthesis protein BcsQ